MGSDLTGHLASAMGPGLTGSIVHNSGIRNIGKLVGQMGGGITGEAIGTVYCMFSQYCTTAVLAKGQQHDLTLCAMGTCFSLQKLCRRYDKQKP
jgi:hypothetical protein